MTPRPGRYFFAAFWLALAMPLCAGERFEMQRRPLVIPEAGTVISNVIVTDQYEFSFVPPTGWRTEVDAKRKTLTFYCYESNAMMVLRIVPKGDFDAYAVERSALRQRVLDLHPRAKILEEFSCYTGSGSGPAFDLEETLPNRPKDGWRLAFVPFAGGVFEFSLFAARQNFDGYLLNFGALLTSFHVEALTIAKK
jgi:hypothetical protein